MSWAKWDAERAIHGDAVHDSLEQSRGRLTSETAQRVRHYTGDGFSQMNKRLRDGTQDAADRKGTDALGRIIGKSKAQHDMVLLHGRTHLADVKPGDEIHEPGFLSTTTDSSMAKNYAGVSKTNAIVRVRLKQGESALSTRGLTDNPTEKEVLLPAGQRYKVLKVQEVKGQFGQPTRLVDVEIHHDEDAGSNRTLTETTKSARRAAARIKESD